MKKIVVPEGMLNAAEQTQMRYKEIDAVSSFRIEEILEAALIWFSENPQMATLKQLEDIWNSQPDSTAEYPYWQKVRNTWAEWQRRMFLAPEPEVPEALKNSELWCKCSDNITLGTLCRHNRPLVGAYMLGKESK